MEKKEDIRKNIYKSGFKPEDLDKETLDKIEWFEEQAKELRRSLGMYATLYVPQTHPVIGHSLMRHGRRLIFTEEKATYGRKSSQRRYGFIESFEPVDDNTMEKDIDKKVLMDSKYGGEKYIKVKVLMEREELIVHVSGKSEDIYIKELKGDW